MKGRSSSRWHPGRRRVLLSGRRRRVPQDCGHDGVPEIPRGHLVTHPLQGEQPGAGDLLRERDPEACHRSLIAQRLTEQHRVTIEHLRPL